MSSTHQWVSINSKSFIVGSSPDSGRWAKASRANANDSTFLCSVIHAADSTITGCAANNNAASRPGDSVRLTPPAA